MISGLSCPLALPRGLGFLLGFCLVRLAPRAPGEAELIKCRQSTLWINDN